MRQDARHALQKVSIELIKTSGSPPSRPQRLGLCASGVNELSRAVRFRPALLLSLLVILPIAATGQPRKDARASFRPNIVFVLIDDFRWDELGVAGHPFIKTPNIDRIAREGARFRNAFMTTPLCSPSRASFLTGQYAHTNGIIDNVDRLGRQSPPGDFSFARTSIGIRNCLCRQVAYGE